MTINDFRYPIVLIECITDCFDVFLFKCVTFRRKACDRLILREISGGIAAYR